MTETTVLLLETRAERIERVMNALTQPVPSTKGMGPKDRANRLHAELERRIALAKESLSYVQEQKPMSDTQTTKLSDHARWEILYFLDVEMDIAKQQMDDPTVRVAILEKIKKYVEGHEYGREYLERRYG